MLTPKIYHGQGIGMVLLQKIIPYHPISVFLTPDFLRTPIQLKTRSIKMARVVIEST